MFTVQITQLFQPTDKVVAFANVTINDCFVVKGIRLLTKKDDVTQLTLAMPSNYSKKFDKFLEVCHPVTNECRTALELAVVAEYYNQLNK